MANEIKQVMEKLDVIKSELDFIKTHMFDPDTIMTTEEEERFERAMQEFKEGKTISLEALKKELRL